MALMQISWSRSAKHAEANLLSNIRNVHALLFLCMCAPRPGFHYMLPKVSVCVKCVFCLAQGPVAYFFLCWLTKEVFLPTVNNLPNPDQDVSRQACILKPNLQCFCCASDGLQSDQARPPLPSGGQKVQSVCNSTSMWKQPEKSLFYEKINSSWSGINKNYFVNKMLTIYVLAPMSH